MKELNPRIKCADGISLSVQANKYAYCSPRIDEVGKWNHYTLVEVGFITDADDKPLTPPDDWREYSDGSFPSDVYGYIPTGMVEAFIDAHGGEISLENSLYSPTSTSICFGGIEFPSSPVCQRKKLDVNGEGGRWVREDVAGFDQDPQIFRPAVVS